jgi:hypothetical protein
MKNVAPKAESEMEKGASLYSNAWQRVKRIPSKTVRAREFTLALFFMDRRA